MPFGRQKCLFLPPAKPTSSAKQFLIFFVGFCACKTEFERRGKASGGENGVNF